MKITKRQLLGIFAYCQLQSLSKWADDVFLSFEAGTLEIEGYERAQWHKFDPNDESTFPPIHDKEYLVYSNCLDEDFFMVDDFSAERWRRSVIAWRELPEVPKF